MVYLEFYVSDSTCIAMVQYQYRMTIRNNLEYKESWSVHEQVEEKGKAYYENYIRSEF